MPGIGVILNPYSRGNRKNPQRAKRLGFIVGDKGSCHATQDAADIEKLAQEFKSRNIEIIGISGGDGTYHLTLSTLLDIYQETPLPKIAFLRGGTMNTVATGVGIRGSPETILSRLIYKYHQDEPFMMAKLPLLKIGNLHGFLWGFGFVSKIIQEYYSYSEPSFWLAARLSIRCWLHLLFQTKWSREVCRRIDAQVRVDGDLWPYKNYVGIFGGSVSNAGLGVKPLWQVRKQLDQFQILGFCPPPRGLLWTLPSLFLGKRIPSEHFLDSLAKEVEIEFTSPQQPMIDGELFEPVSSLRITVGPVLDVIIQ